MKSATEIKVGTYLYDTLNAHLGRAAGGRVSEVLRDDDDVYAVVIALDSVHCRETYATQDDLDSGRWEVRDAWPART